MVVSEYQPVNQKQALNIPSDNNDTSSSENTTSTTRSLSTPGSSKVAAPRGLRIIEIFTLLVIVFSGLVVPQSSTHSTLVSHDVFLTVLSSLLLFSTLAVFLRVSAVEELETLVSQRKLFLARLRQISFCTALVTSIIFFISVVSAIGYGASTAPNSEILMWYYAVCAQSMVVLVSELLQPLVNTKDFLLNFQIHSNIKEQEETVLRAGAVVGSDGVVLEGSGFISERRFSPIPSLRFISKGEQLFSGSEILSGKIRMKAECSGRESSFFEVLSQLPLHTAQQKTPWVPATLAFFAVAALLHLFGETSTGTKGQRIDDWLYIASALQLIIAAFCFVQTLPFVLITLRHKLFLRYGVLDTRRSGSFANKRKDGIVIVSEDFRALRKVRLGSISDWGGQFADPFDSPESRMLATAALLAKSSPLRCAEAARDIFTRCSHISTQWLSDMEVLELCVDGVATKIRDHNLLLGTENYLLNHGVHFEISEVHSEEQLPRLFLSINGEVALALDLAIIGSESLPETLAAVRAQRMRLRFTLAERTISGEEKNFLKESGFESVEVVEKAQLLQDTELTNPVIIYSGDVPESAVSEEMKSVSLQLETFSHLRWNFPENGVCIFTRELQPVLKWVLECRTIQVHKVALFVLVAVLASLAFLCLFILGHSVWLCAVLSVVFLVSYQRLISKKI